jgi:flagellar protein FliO/FliZ
MWQALGLESWWWAIKFVLAFLLVLGLIWGCLYALKRFSGGRLGSPTGTRGRQPRLAVIESTMIDARRQLWLIRRDNVEHLIMTGGPTDLVVEPSIVRAVPAVPAREAAPMREAPPAREPAPPREVASARVTPSFSDAFPRAVPLADGGNWPLQPDAPPARPSRAAPPPPPPAPPAPPPPEAVEPEHDADWSPPGDPALDTEPPSREPAFRAEPVARAEPPPLRTEPPVRAEPMLRAVPDPEPPARTERPPRVVRAQNSDRQNSDRQNSDRLAGMAADLSRNFMDTDLSASPRRAAEPRRPTPPPVQPAESTPPQLSEAEEQNLTEMAQRLESALSRPRPAPEPAPAVPPPAPPALRAVELPRIEPVRPETKPRPEPAPAPAIATTKPAAKAVPTTAPTPATKPAAKPAFGTLEQEMASLLGRSSSGKT